MTCLVYEEHSACGYRNLVMLLFRIFVTAMKRFRSPEMDTNGCHLWTVREIARSSWRQVSGLKEKYPCFRDSCNCRKLHIPISPQRKPWRAPRFLPNQPIGLRVFSPSSSSKKFPPPISLSIFRSSISAAVVVVSVEARTIIKAGDTLEQ